MQRDEAEVYHLVRKAIDPARLSDFVAVVWMGERTAVVVPGRDGDYRSSRRLVLVLGGYAA